MGLDKILCNQIKNNFGKYYANWFPNENIELGDYGIMEGNCFNHIGNIANLDITGLNTHKTQNKVNYRYETANSISTNIVSNNKLLDINSNIGIEIIFKKGKSVFFNAINCEIERFSDKNILGEKILNLYQQNKWKSEWVIITDKIISQNATIIVTESDNSSIQLEGNTSINTSNIMNSNISLIASRKKNIGYTLTSNNPITPLFSICGIKDPWYTSANFKHITKKQILPFGNAIKSLKGGGTINFISAKTIEFGQFE